MLNDVIVVNICDYLSCESVEGLGEEKLKEILSEFSCEKNKDVEIFLKNNAIEFAKKHQSVTYLIFLNDDASLVGYFTIAIKSICVKASILSNSAKRKIERVSELDSEGKTYTLPAYLIAQLGKNFNDSQNNKISGNQLLHAAIDTIKKMQYMAGGTICFLEAENKEKLLDFYEKKNGFKIFDTRVSKSDKHKLVQLLKVIK